MTESALPRWSSPVSVEEMRAGDGADCIQYIQNRCRVTKSSIGGKAKTKLVLRPWQQKETYRLFARTPNTRLRKHRAGLLGVGRKNGKSGISSGFALYIADNCDPGGEIYICAADRDQAGIVGGVIKQMVKFDPYLSRKFKIFRHEIVIPHDDTRISILSSDAATKDGYNPEAVIFDEVHAQPNPDLWDAMSLGMGARVEPLMIGITTAGKRYDRFGKDTLCYRLYDYGVQLAKGEIEDPSFYFTWWEPTPKTKKIRTADGKTELQELPIDWLDPEVWRQGNPGLGDLVSESDIESVSKRTDEASFKTKRCNMWVSKAVSALPDGVWDSRRSAATRVADTLSLAGGKRQVYRDLLRDSVLFLDGSWSGDSTGIVGCTRDGHLFVVTHHEKRQFDGPSWRVPVNSVKQDIRDCFGVGARLLLLDPYRWQQTAEDLVDEGFPVVEWPTNSIPRIVPAWKSYYDAVMDGELTHDGDKAMSRHHSNLVLKVDAKGSRPTKEHPTSVRHIDLAICAIGAYVNRNLEVNSGKKISAWVLSS